MSGSLPRIRKAIDALAVLNGLVATILFVGLTLVVSLQVLTRFVLHIPFIWSEEVARFLFFWVALLGAAMSVRARRHFVLDVRGAGRRADRKPSAASDPQHAAPGISPGLHQRDHQELHLSDLIPDLCVFAFSLFLLAQGVGYTGVGWLRTASNSQVNMGLVYAAIPVFAALSALYAAGNLFVDVTALREDGTAGSSATSEAGGGGSPLRSSAAPGSSSSFSPPPPSSLSGPE